MSPSTSNSAPERQARDARTTPAAAERVERDATIGLWAANLFGIGFLPVAGAATLGPYILLHGAASLGPAFRNLRALAIVVPAFAVAVVAHELLHAAGYRWVGGARRADLRFGMNWKALTPYAHCSAAMSARAYRTAVALPGIALGLLPAALALPLGSAWLSLFGFLMTAAAGGDAAVLWAVRRVPGDRQVRDHPRRAGCEILLPADDPALPPNSDFDTLGERTAPRQPT